MNKKNNLALLAFVVVGLFSSFALTVFAQTTDVTKNEQSAKTCTGEKFVMPETISVGNDAFADYIKVASLPRSERQKSFRNFSNEQKASFVKVQFALQFVKRPNLTSQQRDFLFESMSKISADLYDKENPQKVALSNTLNQEAEAKVFGLFDQKDAFEILEDLGANKVEDIAFLQKYEDLLKLNTEIRRKVSREMPVNERVSIWKTQLAYHLATSSFNQEQKAFIVKIVPNIQSIFEASANLPKEERTKYFDALESSMFKVFTKAEAFAIFMEIGIHKNVRNQSQLSEQFKVEYTGQNHPLFQTIKLNFSKIALNSQAWSCDCRWYCSGDRQTCENRICREANYCGPFDTSTCTSRCIGGLAEEEGPTS